MRKFLKYCLLCTGVFMLLTAAAFSQSAKDTAKYYLLRPMQLFDGKELLKKTWVLVKGNEIKAVGAAGTFDFPASTIIVDMPNQTLLPGLIDGHTHLFLHPYTEASWEVQMIKESRAERVIRAANSAKTTLMAGFTTIRDMGTLGVGYEDVGLDLTIAKGVVPGPRMLKATRGLSASSGYSFTEFANENSIPKGAAEADGKDAILKEVRTQIGSGADVIYVFCESFPVPGQQSTATFTVEELKLIADLCKSANKMIVGGARHPDAIKRAIDAGITAIAHGDDLTTELAKLMKLKGIILYPTIAETEMKAQLRGWKRGIDNEPAVVKNKRETVDIALKNGVQIGFGSDAGGYVPHGKNYLEVELLVDYGMSNLQALTVATSGNADLYELSSKVGRIKVGLMADMIAVDGDPTKDVSKIEQIKFVMKNGMVYRNELTQPEL